MKRSVTKRVTVTELIEMLYTNQHLQTLTYGIECPRDLAIEELNSIYDKDMIFEYKHVENCINMWHKPHST